MSEGVQASPRHSGGFRIRNPQDFWGGVVTVIFALAAFWAARDLPGMRGFAFGPGTAPRLFAGMLGGLGALVMLTGVLTDGPRVGRFYVRGPLFLTLAVLVFAFMIRGAGLVIASFLAIVVASFATTESRFWESLIWGAVLTGFCVLVFPIALNLPLQLWPNSLNPLTWLSFR